MKTLLLSDIHSNIDALHAIWEREKDADCVYCAGDLVDYGFFPHEVLAWCREHEVQAVAGNHDRELTAIAAGKQPLTAGTFAAYNLSLLDEKDLDYLNRLPDERRFVLDGYTYYMTHCCIWEDWEAYPRSLTTYTSYSFFRSLWTQRMSAELCAASGISPNENRRIICGHTHHCGLHLPAPGACMLNPGSASYRLGGESAMKGADYMVIEDGVILPRHVSYPSAHLLEMVEQADYLNEQQKATGRSFYAPQEPFE